MFAHPSNWSLFAVALFLSASLVACDAGTPEAPTTKTVDVELTVADGATNSWSLKASPDVAERFEAEVAQNVPAMLEEYAGDTRVILASADGARDFQVSGNGSLNEAETTELVAFVSNSIAEGVGAGKGALFSGQEIEPFAQKAENCNLRYEGDRILGCHIRGNCGDTIIDEPAQDCHCTNSCHMEN